MNRKWLRKCVYSYCCRCQSPIAKVNAEMFAYVARTIATEWLCQNNSLRMGEHPHMPLTFMQTLGARSFFGARVRLCVCTAQVCQLKIFELCIWYEWKMVFNFVCEAYVILCIWQFYKEKWADKNWLEIGHIWFSMFPKMNKACECFNIWNINE